MAWKGVTEPDISSQTPLRLSLTFPQGSTVLEKKFNLHTAETIINPCQQQPLEGATEIIRVLKRGCFQNESLCDHKVHSLAVYHIKYSHTYQIAFFLELECAL